MKRWRGETVSFMSREMSAYVPLRLLCFIGLPCEMGDAVVVVRKQPQPSSDHSAKVELASSSTSVFGSRPPPSVRPRQ